jgi:CheY-like chemotaxis protein
VNARILVVDDQPSIISIFVRYFEPKGCSVRGAVTAEEALAAAERERFDVIFLDNVLPGMSGLQAIGELNRRSDAPIFLITGHLDDHIMKDALLLGARGVYSKPLDLGMLEKLILGILTRT